LAQGSNNIQVNFIIYYNFIGEYGSIKKTPLEPDGDGVKLDLEDNKERLIEKIGINTVFTIKNLEEEIGDC
jgi:hypothetical protein